MSATSENQISMTTVQPNMQQVAWIVLSSAFMAFCFVCAGVSFGTHYFLYRSTVPMNAQVEVSRGSVGLIRTDLSESFEVEGRPLARGERVITDSQSQAVISVEEVKRRGELVASVTVKNNSEMIVQSVRQPRFDRSRLGYSISLFAVNGEVDIFVPKDLYRDVGFSVFLPNNVVVDISEAGRYTLTLDIDDISLSTWEGQAAILPPDRHSSRPVVSGQVGVYDMETGEIDVNMRYIDLVANNNFRTPPASSVNVTQSVPGSLASWNCNDRTENAPLGSYEAVHFDGREVLRFFRGEQTGSHGETICIQPFGPSGQVGQPVEQYDYLELRTTFYIEHQSLDACGEKGSECPLMLLMEYVDQNGRPNQWFHGFYSKLESRSDYPLTCASCSQDHKRVNDRTWYTYESGNFFSLLPDGTRPTSILNIRFYASGHDYEVYVSNLSLLAAPPDDEDEAQDVQAG